MNDHVSLGPLEDYHFHDTTHRFRPPHLAIEHTFFRRPRRHTQDFDG
jgi:hypothetical protein